MMLPPRWVRRVVIGPVPILLAVLMAVAMPLWVVVAAFASRLVPGRWRPLRLLWFLLVWLILQAVMMIALFVLWLASGLGWKLRSEGFAAAHYRLAAWFLGRLIGSARLTFGLGFEVELEGEMEASGHPLVVMARHAGPGDSLLLIHAVLNRLGRTPRVVLKDILQWDPMIDTLLNRLPSRFIPTGGRTRDSSIDAIADLAATMGDKDALIIFPEGGNFTPGRWIRAIERLEESGLTEFALRARAMEHLLPPKPGGIVAAITSAPEAAVVLVGHSGLEDLDNVGDLWRGLKMDVTVQTKIWAFAADQLPTSEEELGVWLYDRWAEMNAWIESHRPRGAEPASG